MTLATTLLSLLLAQAPTGDHRAEPAPAPRALPPNAAALLRASFAADPPVSYVKNAATALAQAEPERARSLVARARWAGLLPDVRVRLDRRFARTESLDLGRADPTATPVGVDAVNDLRYEFRATWELSRVVFNPDEIGASAHALRMADVRREIESAVIRVYFERRRLKAEALTSDATDTASGVRLELRIQELEAELDALSGGAFSRWRSSRNGDPPSGPP
jgi:hypothetical protein